MAHPHRGWSDPIPDEDWLEQQQPGVPALGDEQTWSPPPDQDANEADGLEQVMPVPTDPDEEYPPDRG
jgi:hypothetical protein